MIYPWTSPPKIPWTIPTVIEIPAIMGMEFEGYFHTSKNHKPHRSRDNK